MAYKYHPEIEGLKINENGTAVLRFGNPLVIKQNKAHNYVLIHGKQYRIIRLICECWQGMAENPRWIATKIDKNKALHYDNVVWMSKGKKAKN